MAAAAAPAQDDLAERLNRFAEAYNGFAGELRAGKLDVKKAARLSKLWRDVERSGEWPAVGRSGSCSTC
jgi:hypothetical protein